MFEGTKAAFRTLPHLLPIEGGWFAYLIVYCIFIGLLWRICVWLKRIAIQSGWTSPISVVADPVIHLACSNCTEVIIIDDDEIEAKEFTCPVCKHITKIDD